MAESFQGVHLRQEGSSFGAANVTGGYLLQGNFHALTINSAPARPEFTGQFSHASLDPVGAFVARPALRDLIHTRLWEDGDGNGRSGTRTLVVSGPGGFGKTQLLLDYVQQYRTDYKATFWLEASRPASLERDFVNLWQLLREPTHISHEQVDVENAIVGVKGWLASRPGPWLMVFDGADTIEDDSVSGYIDIKRYIPNAVSMHVILTTRSSTAKGMTRLESVVVGDLEEHEAVELFGNYSQLHRSDHDFQNEIKTIVQELGYLALAIALAATYIGNTPRLQSNIAAYLPEYRQRRHTILSQRAEKLTHGYSESVLTTWESSFEAICAQSEGATALLSLLSFLSFDDIFPQLFDTNKDGTASWHDRVFSDSPIDSYQIESFFQLLKRYSLIQWQEVQASYRMHKMVHTWCYERLETEIKHKLSLAALTLILDAINESGRKPEERLRLLPHIMANLTPAAEAIAAADGKEAEDAINALVSTGSFVDDLGRWSEVAMIRGIVAMSTRQLLGDGHPHTISAMSDLALTIRNRGQLEIAAQIQTKVVAKMREYFGDEDPHTMSAINNLANTLEDQGQLESAGKMKEFVLQKRRLLLGNDHPDTISAMVDLGTTLTSQGQLEMAATLETEALEKTRRLLGDNHLDTLKAMHNLAGTLIRQGQLEVAAKMQTEVVEKMRQLLGDDHPNTISAMSNLAATIRGQGQLETVVEIDTDVLDRRRRLLGDDHHETISAMHNLAGTLYLQGQLESAIKIQTEVLEKIRQLLGDDHFDTITAMSNLAVKIRAQGRREAAAKIQTEALEKMRRLLGDNHLDTISAMGNLATTLKHQGQQEMAMKMETEVLEKRRRFLRDDHADTAAAMHNLAITLRRQGQAEQAAEMQTEALEKMRRLLGDDHPNTISAMDSLAHTLYHQGQQDMAVKMQIEVLEKQQRILGEDHPDTINTVIDLKSMREKHGQQEAVKIEKEMPERSGETLSADHDEIGSASKNSATTTKSIKPSLYRRMKTRLQMKPEGQ